MSSEHCQDVSNWLPGFLSPLHMYVRGGGMRLSECQNDFGIDESVAVWIFVLSLVVEWRSASIPGHMDRYIFSLEPLSFVNA